MFGSVSGAFGSASGSPRAGSVAAPGRSRSGVPDAKVYASPRTNHGSAHPLALDVGNHQPVHRVVADGVQCPPQVEHPPEEASPAVRPLRHSGVTQLAAPGELLFQCYCPSLYLVRTRRGTAARAARRKRGKL